MTWLVVLESISQRLSSYSQMKDYCVAENLTWLLLQVAVMSGNFELGEIIKNHNDMDVGKCVSLK